MVEQELVSIYIFRPDKTAYINFATELAKMCIFHKSNFYTLVTHDTLGIIDRCESWKNTAFRAYLIYVIAI